MKILQKVLVLFSLVLLLGLGLNFAIDNGKNELGVNLIAADDMEDTEDVEDSNNGDDGVDSDEDVCTQERAMERIETAEQKLEKAREQIEEKEGQGKDVSQAREQLEQAEQELEQARESLQKGDCEGSEDTAKGVKHKANLAKGKNILSVSEKGTAAREFGMCISEAATSIKDVDDKHEAFKECHEELKNKIKDIVDDDLPDNDQIENEKIHDYIDELLLTAEDESLIEILNQYKDYNFSGVNADEVIEEIDSILDDDKEMPEKIEKLQTLLDDLKEESANDKYDDGTIPFEDTDDDDWFFAYADLLKEEACIQGFVNGDGTLTGEFRPGDEVLFSDSLKFVMSCMLGEVAQTVEEGNHWAVGWALTLQTEYGEFLSEQFLARIQSAIQNQAEFNEALTRAEIVAFILDILEIDVPEAVESPFDDLSGDHPYFNEIVYASELGLISGDEETNTVRPDDVPNRAEMVKIIILAKELL
jgi:TolA-binding protein